MKMEEIFIFTEKASLKAREVSWQLSCSYKWTICIHADKVFIHIKIKYIFEEIRPQLLVLIFELSFFFHFCNVPANTFMLSETLGNHKRSISFCIQGVRDSMNFIESDVSMSPRWSSEDQMLPRKNLKAFAII